MSESIKVNRIAIFGGTFDPIHYGHMQMARAAVSELDSHGMSPDLVYIIPAGRPYFKRYITPYGMRREMVQMAVDELNASDSTADHTVRYMISDLESDEAQPTYTFQTLQKLHGMYPGSELYFMCGRDVFTSIHSWYHPEMVLSEATLAVFDRSVRSDAHAALKASADEERIRNLKQICDTARVYFFDTVISDISSTMVRERIAAGESIDDLVPAGVADFIHSHGLYIN